MQRACFYKQLNKTEMTEIPEMHRHNTANVKTLCEWHINITISGEIIRFITSSPLTSDD